MLFQKKDRTRHTDQPDLEKNILHEEAIRETRTEIRKMMEGRA